MATIPQEDFLAWCAECGIEINPRYVKSWPRNLWFKGDPAEHIFYRRTREPSQIHALLKALFASSAADVWLLWAKEPPCTLGGTFELSADALRIFANRSESLLKYLVSHLLQAGTTCDDVFIVPGHAQHFFMLDHHEAIFVEFASEQEQIRFQTAMHGHGFDLPTELPDETFKRPGWMNPK